MPSYNRIIQAGHLTRDIELRTTQSGTVVAKGGIANNRRRGEQEETLFLDWTAFGRTAEALAQYLGKGSPVLLEGRLQLEQWEDAEGQRRSKHSMIVESFAFLDSKPVSGKTAGRSGGASRGAGTSEVEDYGEIPF